MYCKVSTSLLSILLSLFISAPKAMSQSQEEFTPPQNMEMTEFYLLTVGLGAGLHERYGHTILKIRDLEQDTEQNINWGIFDFRDPLFAWKFFKGQLDYMMGFNSSSGIVRMYEYFQRRVESQKLNLTNMQKQTLINRIIWNAKPENRMYRYQYFYDNCATKPRDYFDEALGGVIKKTYENEFATKVFRNYVYENLNAPPPVAFSLDILMNDRLDHPLSKWHEMFLPSKLQEYLMKMPAYDDNGQAIPGSHFLSHEKEVLVQGKNHPSSPIEVYHIATAVFIMILVWAGLLIGPFKPGTHRLNAKVTAGYRILGLGALVWGIFSSVFSIVMMASWAFSEHLDLHHNVNLYLFWPFDFVIGFIGIYILFLGRPLSVSPRIFAPLKAYLKTHVVVTIIFIAAGAMGVFDQNVKRLLTTLVPMQVLLLFMVQGKSLISKQENFDED